MNQETYRRGRVIIEERRENVGEETRGRGGMPEELEGISCPVKQETGETNSGKENNKAGKERRWRGHGGGEISSGGGQAVAPPFEFGM